MIRWSDSASTGLLLAIVVLASGSASAASARAESTPVWRFEPALAPPPSAGTPPAPYGVPVGQVGQISFWAPNRGLLIDGSGLDAYNGVNWHQLSTVCGGSEGRIAWAGPDEFWTISDQRGGQDLPPELVAPLQSISLCHFLDGQVIGSYAMPLEQADSYRPMDAAACYSPSDCWFGGQAGSPPNTGAFHLHWNGSSVTTVYAPGDQAVTGMVNFDDELFESVSVAEAGEAVIHTIAPIGSQPFSELYLYPQGEEQTQTLPEYDGQASELESLLLASNGSPLGAGATQLWATAGSRHTSLTVLHCVEAACAAGEWSQVLPTAERTDDGVRLMSVPAPEPGSESAWLSLHSEGEAEVARLNTSGALESREQLPGPQEAEIGYRGTAGPITCPAPHDCWMATDEGTNPITHEQSTPGWIFHLTNGTEYPQDTDPNFAGIISYRPPDASVPVVYPELPPEDDSLANQVTLPTQSGPPTTQPSAQSGPPASKAKPLVMHVKSRLLRGRTLVISFVLTAPAHVQLIGRRGKRVVARTRAQSLRTGAHKLSLSLNPADWPTKLKFEVTPLEAPTPASSGGSAGGSDTVST